MPAPAGPSALAGPSAHAGPSALGPSALAGTRRPIRARRPIRVRRHPPAHPRLPAPAGPSASAGTRRHIFARRHRHRPRPTAHRRPSANPTLFTRHAAPRDHASPRRSSLRFSSLRSRSAFRLPPSTFRVPPTAFYLPRSGHCVPAIPYPVPPTGLRVLRTGHPVPRSAFRPSRFRPPPLRVSALRLQQGSSTRNTVPPPGASSTSIHPSCSFTMPEHTARPNPVPPAPFFVV
jgi:hypothetical protein